MPRTRRGRAELCATEAQPGAMGMCRGPARESVYLQQPPPTTFSCPSRATLLRSLGVITQPHPSSQAPGPFLPPRLATPMGSPDLLAFLSLQATGVTIVIPQLRKAHASFDKLPLCSHSTLCRDLSCCPAAQCPPTTVLWFHSRPTASGEVCLCVQMPCAQLHGQKEYIRAGTGGLFPTSRTEPHKCGC